MESVYILCFLATNFFLVKSSSYTCFGKPVLSDSGDLLRVQSRQLLAASVSSQASNSSSASSKELDACSAKSVYLTSTFVRKKFNEHHTIIDEVEFLKKFGTQLVLDGDASSPADRKGSSALLKSLLQYLKDVWIIENQIYALNHILELRRKYGILDNIAVVFLTTYDFSFNSTTETLVSHQYRAPGKVDGKSVVRLSQQNAAFLDGIIIQQPLLRERWPALADRMHFIPSWPRGKVSSQEAVRARPPRQAAEGGYVLMAGEKDRDFASGIEACALAKVRVRLVSDSEGLKNLCTREKLCTLTPFLSHGDFMDVLEKSWAVVVPLHPQRHLSAGATLVGEALASGVPVVVSGGLGGDEPWKGVVGHEETGLIVPPGDVGALSSAVSRLMEDGELYGRISANARALAESAYSVEAVGKSMQEAVCGAIAYRNSHRTTRSQEEQEQGRAAFNSFIEDGELDED